MSRTNYEAVADFAGHWLHRAQVSLLTGATGQIESHCSRATSEKRTLLRAWCGPGAGLVRQTHYPRQPADVEASKVGILPRKKIQSSPSPPSGEDVLAETCAEEGLVCLTHQQAVTPVRG